MTMSSSARCRLFSRTTNTPSTSSRTPVDRDVRIYAQQRQKSKSNTKKKTKDKYEFPGSMPASFQKDVTRALEQAKRAEKVWSCEITDFYSPPLCDWLEKAVKKNFGDAIVCDRTGGYRGRQYLRRSPRPRFLPEGRRSSWC